MIIESREIEQFWQEKEKEYQSTLVIATPADYVNGWPDLTAPVNGLLYILRNGIYFENFPNENWFGMRFRTNERFIKVKLQFKKEDIIGVSCFHRKKNKRPLTFPERLSLFFSPASRLFTITCMHSGCERNVIFSCLKKPLLLCDAYDSDFV
jgi:hypothetical protein